MSRFNFRRFIYWCFIVYCVMVFSVLFLRGIGGDYDFSSYPYWKRVMDRTNLVPFATIGEQLGSIANSIYNRRVAIRNLLANLLLFVPMGLYLPLRWNKLRQFGKCLWVWLGLILIIEIIQVLTLQGSFDIDDVILNTLGFFIGYGLFVILSLFVREER